MKIETVAMVTMTQREMDEMVYYAKLEGARIMFEVAMKDQCVDIIKWQRRYQPEEVLKHQGIVKP